MELIYKGETRPFYYLSNYGNINLENNDILEICGKRLYLKRLNKSIYLSNCISYCKYGLVENQIEFLEQILKGEKYTPLEIDINCIEQISIQLPKKDFYMSHYQFSNQVRPTTKVLYDGKYKKDINQDFKYDAIDFAWHIYRNLYKILPDGFTKCDAELYENLPYLYDYNF